MGTRVKLIACLLQFICLAFGRHIPGNKPIIVCYVQLHSEMDEPFRAQLAKCAIIIVCDDTCDRSNPLLPYRGADSAEKLCRLKDSAQHAKFMLSVVVNPFELQTDEGSDRFCHEMQHCLNGDGYDGIDLDFDPTMLDEADQLNYARFLLKLRNQCNPSAILSTTIGALRLMPGPMVNAFIETLNFIVITRDEMPSNNDQGGEFVLRKYPDSVIDSMLAVGFPLEKIVLGLKSAGALTNPSSEQDQYFKKCSKIGSIPYGQVCELRDQSKRFCSWRYDRRCLIFDGQSKVLYDSSETAKKRALQCAKRNLKGVSILLDQDDDAGICEGTKFPLLNAIKEAFEKHDSAKECSTVEPVEDNKNGDEKDRLADELTRLEKAIEDIEKFTSLLQKIVSFLFRTMDKVIDVVISLTGKKPAGGPKEAEAKEVEAKEAEAKEVEAKEAEAKEDEAKEAEAKEVEAKESEAKEVEAKEAGPVKLDNEDINPVEGSEKSYDLENVEPSPDEAGQQEEIEKEIKEEVPKEVPEVVDVPQADVVQRQIDYIKDGLGVF